MPCPVCKNPKSYVYGRRVGCMRCDARWSITSGTVMADTKLPLTVWFRAMHLMSSTKQGISAVDLGRRLGVSYPTAWYLHKRLRHAMTERDDRHRLGGSDDSGAAPVVEVDDVDLGGERNEDSGTAGKTCLLAACERHPGGRMGYVALQVVSGFSSEATREIRDAHIATDATVHTDGLKAFNVFGEGGRTHVATVTGSKRRLLLEHQSTPQYARHGRCSLQSHRNLFPPYPSNRLRIAGRLVDKRATASLTRCRGHPKNLPLSGSTRQP
jgi:transposase-like protein